jgi:hypothetical protein
MASQHITTDREKVLGRPRRQVLAAFQGARRLRPQGAGRLRLKALASFA